MFLGRLEGVLEALDARTGRDVWQNLSFDPQEHYLVAMAPQFVNGLITIGSSGGEFKTRGEVAAFNAETGAPVWHAFMTLPGPSWAGSSRRHGGGNVWQTPAVDPALGLIYVSTGNASPDIDGVERRADKLFASSIVGLDVVTAGLAGASRKCITTFGTKKTHSRRCCST